jgi:hypothetical protein
MSILTVMLIPTSSSLKKWTSMPSTSYFALSSARTESASLAYTQARSMLSSACRNENTHLLPASPIHGSRIIDDKNGVKLSESFQRILCVGQATGRP